MSKTSKTKHDDNMRTEYRFDYSKAKPNRFAAAAKGSRVVILEPDVAKVFENSEAVNKALRALLEAIPKKVL